MTCASCTSSPSHPVPGATYAVGWYRDDRQPRLHRYWDGQAWRTPPVLEPERHGFAVVGGLRDVTPETTTD